MTLVAITGASRGIGRASALAFAERQLSLALIGRPSDELESCRKAALEAGAPEVRVYLAELTNPASIDSAAAELLATQGAPDALINNAGVVHRKPIELTSVAMWEEQIGVNLTAPFVLTRALLPAMRARGSGRIVHVGSISSTMGTPRLAAYCAAKWGLIGFMKSLAEEITDTGLMTVAILPGSVETQMLEGSGFPARMSPSDVARSIVHYALDAPLAHNGGVIEMLGV